MTEDEDCEIEFLDEDADIVQQCVQNVDNETDIKPALMETTLLVERVPNEKPTRKRRKKEEDSDYDPTEDLPTRSRKKKLQQYPRQSATRGRRFESSYVHKTDGRSERKYRKLDSKAVFVNRKLLNIKIPDYDDPLCLPVRAMKKDEWDARKLKNWNNLCLEHFKHYDNPLRAEKEQTVSSKRTIVLRNIHNKMTGKVETTMYSKICVENKNEDKRSEVVQSVLPKYREKKVLNTFRLSDQKKRRSFHHKDEVLLTKEVNKEVETLVVYKPEEKLSLVYKMFEKKSDNVKDMDEENKKYLKEVASCKTCAPCYQTSWRGFKKNDKRNIRCQVCMRPCISVYNLLAHLKSHSEADVRSSKRAIARSLASVVEYHYKCRICQEQFLSIKELRQHVNTHKGTEPFKCEVGNHHTT
ncbi:zinc finger protein 652-like [Vanessa atalanta]|uniref:zinc finger protein 652-like n=1 Tax=Vanessa atalanta TaxID=42275 RepID=UPI001FCDA58F|nr:zinc finger protein 652-like [Vanessa atalanta]